MSYLRQFYEVLGSVCINPFQHSYHKFTRKQSIENGKVLSFGEFSESTLVGSYGDCDSADFSISNYQALGVLNSLKYRVFPANNVDSFVNQFENAETSQTTTES